MAEVFEFEEQKITWKHKMNGFMHEAKYKVKSGINWVVNNPEKAAGVVTLGGMVLGAGRKGYKTISKAVADHNAEREMYCGTVNRKVRLRSPLTDTDIKMLGELMQKGDTRYEALNKLGLIK